MEPLSHTQFSHELQEQSVKFFQESDLTRVKAKTHIPIDARPPANKQFNLIKYLSVEGRGYFRSPVRHEEKRRRLRRTGWKNMGLIQHPTKQIGTLLLVRAIHEGG